MYFHPKRRLSSLSFIFRVCRPSALTRKGSRDSVARDHAHPDNMPRPRHSGQHTGTARPQGDALATHRRLLELAVPSPNGHPAPPVSFFTQLNTSAADRKGSESDTDAGFPLLRPLIFFLVAARRLRCEH